MLELNRLYNMDCMEGMAQFPDGYFELAIVDLPYGGGNNKKWDGKKRGRFGGWFDAYKIECNRTGGGYAEKLFREETKLKKLRELYDYLSSNEDEKISEGFGGKTTIHPYHISYRNGHRAGQIDLLKKILFYSDAYWEDEW